MINYKIKSFIIKSKNSKIIFQNIFFQSFNFIKNGLFTFLLSSSLSCTFLTFSQNIASHHPLSDLLPVYLLFIRTKFICILTYKLN